MADDTGVSNEVGLIQGNGERAILKIPISLLAVLVSIFVSICGLWWNLVKANADLSKQQAINNTATQKDIQSLTRIVTRMDKRLDDSYSRADAVADFSRVNNELADHEQRLRRLEAKFSRR